MPSPPEASSFPRAGDEAVVPLLSAQRVEAGAADEKIVADPGDDDVVAGLACEVVVAVLALEGVLALAADQKVVAGAAVEPVVAGIAPQLVVALRADDHVEVVAAGDLIVAVVAAQGVLAGRAEDRVRAVAAVDDIVAGTRMDGVVAVVAVEGVVRGGADDRVVARAALDRVDLGAAGERVRVVGPRLLLGAEEAVFQRDIRKLALAAVAAGVMALAEGHAAVGEGDAVLVGLQVDRGDAEGGEGLHLAGADLAVLVLVLPDAEIGEVRIGRVELVVAVRIESLAQAFEIGRRAVPPAAEGNLHDVAELAVRAEAAIRGKIEDEDAVVGRGPGGRLEIAVAVEIHPHRRGGPVQDLVAVAVEVDQDRRAVAVAFTVGVVGTVVRGFGIGRVRVGRVGLIGGRGIGGWIARVAFRAAALRRAGIGARGLTLSGSRAGPCRAVVLGVGSRRRGGLRGARGRRLAVDAGSEVVVGRGRGGHAGLVVFGCDLRRVLGLLREGLDGERTGFLNVGKLADEGRVRDHGIDLVRRRRVGLSPPRTAALRPTLRRLRLHVGLCGPGRRLPDPSLRTLRGQRRIDRRVRGLILGLMRNRRHRRHAGVVPARRGGRRVPAVVTPVRTVRSAAFCGELISVKILVFIWHDP